MFLRLEKNKSDKPTPSDILFKKYTQKHEETPANGTINSDLSSISSGAVKGNNSNGYENGGFSGDNDEEKTSLLLETKKRPTKN